MKGQNLKFLAGVIVILAILGAVLKTWYVDIVTVNHDGMAPTLFAGDTVVVWRDPVPEHGAIMLCRHPTDDTRFVIGRVIGRNGADISADRGRLRIEGSFPAIDWRGEVQVYDRAEHARVATQWGIEALGNDDHLIFLRRGRTFRINPISDYDGVYLLDDNRSYTGEDSREFGPIPESRCIGHVFLRVGMSPDTPPEIGNRSFQFLD
jgi:signal peptidase I